MTDQEQKEWDLKLRRMDAQVAHYYAALERMAVENAKFQAETAKLMTENRWYSAVVASGATLAVVAIVKLFL